MGKQLQLSIANPCHEDWDKMTPSEQGHFCSSCQKHVIDFTGMSDAQLVAFFRKPSMGSVCGRFFSDQLDRPIDIPKKHIPWVKYFFQFALPAFLASAKVAAQGNVAIKNKHIEAISSNPAASKEAIDPAMMPGKVSISGRVINHNNDLLPSATIAIKGTTITAVADANGIFKLDNIDFLPGMTLEISYSGYFTEQRIISPGSGDAREIVVQLKPNMATLETVVIKSYSMGRMMGGVMGGITMVQPKETAKSEVTKPVKPSVAVYPNPVQRNNTVNIEWQHTKDEIAKLTVIGMGGNLVLSQSKNITKGLNRISVIADGRWAAGIYIVQLQNEKGEVINNTKLVVN